MEIVINHSLGQSVSKVAEVTKIPFEDEKGSVNLQNVIKIKDIYHLGGNEPLPNEQVTAYTKDKIFSCIFVNNQELKILHNGK